MMGDDNAELYYRTLTVLRVAAPLVDRRDLEAACFLTGIEYQSVVQPKQEAA